ncbi:AAA family ATPase [Nocardioides marmorisolisilvae]|uniref:Nuclease SbcCD subunit C n=1 Tax=Nocardioides marmorisolisilvae TaxID=1542737 RepID=A0A3N0DUN9_9ACTN|nr:SMC family ATPase [Nocardioides marmorisolisilvae]RNL79310.1 SMC family ATPase [Nocardioides marmorisolisilvae]
MRLHHLSVTAFGPFADTVEVDFDELSAAGLFLLTGATGAGKTSVLDAVCFALYGAVPGDRAGAKHLRSDHAGPQVAPSVSLRLSIGDRQFLFTRSPAWDRPKLRGSGETREQARVLVEELREGTWTTLTNRLDDAGLLVTDLLGMTATQFTQVAMLPQGRFQAFLRATSAERHSVLQQLFRTDRFERVERWLVERRTAARRTSEAGADAVLETLNRVREAAGETNEPGWTGDLVGAAESGAVTEWTRALQERSTAAAASAVVRSTAADEALAAAEAALTLATAQHDHRRRALAAQADLALLASEADALTALANRLEEHRRAAPLAALSSSSTNAGRALERARQRWAERVGFLAALGLADDVDRDDLLAAQRRAHAAHTRASAHAARAEAGREAEARSAAVRAELQSLEASVAELEVVIAELPAVITEAVAAVHEARAAAARHPVVAGKIVRLDELNHAARRAELVELELSAARTDVIEATEQAQLTREIYLDVREARINGMAGELAGQLAVGCSCPVCGSAEHPSPATLSAGSVNRSDEDQARKVHEDAAFVLQSREVVLSGLESELAVLDERLDGVDRAGLPSALDAARAESERLEPLVAALDVLTDRELTCRARLREAEQKRAEALLERAALAAEKDQLGALLEGIADEWEAVLADPGAAPEEDPEAGLALIVAGRARLAAGYDDTVADLDALAEADRRAREAEAELSCAALDAGFEDLAAALSALLPEEDADRAQDRLTRAEVRTRTAEQVLADPAVAEALSAAPVELESTAATRAQLAEAARLAASARHAAELRRDRVGVLSRDAADRLRAWAPLRERHRTVAELAALVEGKSVDNPLRMRLAAYVLAERLRQVVAAANERLAGMTDQRYALEHSDDRGVGEQRGGLSLRVRDDWNGETRDPATLSGGETFVVSLALALGLADTVAHEAGGTDIDTLFIDEGFGSLDADTLEDVMDTLDSLRDGGRVVGLVSHVPELRSRISTQLEVSKGRTGSSVRAALGDH